MEAVNAAEGIIHDTESKMEEFKDQLPTDEVIGMLTILILCVYRACVLLAVIMYFSVCLSNFCKQNISKTNLWIFAKFAADAAYTLTFGADPTQGC